MKVEYFVWEKDGLPMSWAVVEGDAQTLGDFPEYPGSMSSAADAHVRTKAEMDMVYWCEDRAQPLPFRWRPACDDEIEWIRELQ